MRTTLTCEYIFYVTLLYSNALGDLIFSKSLVAKDEVKESHIEKQCWVSWILDVDKLLTNVFMLHKFTGYRQTQKGMGGGGEKS